MAYLRQMRVEHIARLLAATDLSIAAAARTVGWVDPNCSSGGMSLEEIADLCGHSGTAVTEAVCRHELRPMLLRGAAAMDRIFGRDG